jgi:hypothetical protein
MIRNSIGSMMRTLSPFSSCAMNMLKYVSSCRGCDMGESG